jgi:hypothetical protein
MRNLGATAFAVLAVTLGMGVACSSEDDGNEIEAGGGSGGAGPSGGSGGSAATGGSGGTSATGGTSGAAGVYQYDSGVGGSTGGTGGSSYTACPTLVGLEECGFESEAAEPLEVNVLLVMDKSGSMDFIPNDSYGTTTKWDAMNDALTEVLAGDARDKLNLGLEFFPTTATPGSPIPVDCDPPVDRCCEMPEHGDMNVDIGPGTETVPLILEQLRGTVASPTRPAGGTPTARALERAFVYFTEGPGADLEGENIVLLATDGGPNCNPDTACEVEECTINIDSEPDDPCPPGGANCCATYPPGCLDHAGTLAQIEQLAEAGVRTIVVGIPGAEEYYTRLEEYAEAGGFINPDGSYGYYEVSAGGGIEELTQTFDAITIALIQRCEIPVTQEIPNPNVVNVAVDCEVIPKGEEAGTESRWYFDDPDNPTRIIIDGPICDTIQNEGVERLDTVYGCPTQLLG